MKTIFNRIIRAGMVALLLFAVNFKSSAQDVIVKKTGEEIKAKVEQISDTDIKYRKSDNLTGPVYSVAKSDVFMIKYENGTKDVFGNQTSPVVTQPAAQLKPSFSEKDILPARNAETMGYILAAPILVLGITAGTIQNHTTLVNAMGGVATLIAGIGIPLVASGAEKTRRATGVEGNLGLRIAGWVGYGLALTDAVTIIGLSVGGADMSGAPSYSVTLLGVASCILIAVDARQTHIQANDLLKHASIQPTIGTVRDFYGRNYPTAGMIVNF